jgi:outer membrane biosynthesis protein TonB
VKMVKHTSPRKTLSISIFPALFLTVPLLLFFFISAFTSQAEEIKEQEKILPRTSYDLKSKTGKNVIGSKTVSKKDTAKTHNIYSPTGDMAFLFAESKKTVAPVVTDKNLAGSVSSANGQVPLWLASLAGENKSDDKTVAQTTDNRSVLFISQRINSHNEEIQDCYYNYLKIDPDIAGHLVVRIFINGEGKVHKAELVESNIGDAQLEREILEKIESWDDFEKSPQNSLHVYRQEYIFGE